ncbi:MAG: SEL1-like repeat protein [Devosia sp.]|uniref:peptidoglycan-binding protein n=1 Tax=Devosia sp. TaxID=1871048 RepID=UPI0024CA3E07|nr:peptidoglycan-binding protein [Devosia sp.]UYN99313.1 MAG: SEL1-like repeat protein [Devosia sp.]
MARAYNETDYSDRRGQAGAGEWQALRGELVALLDKVESRYSPADQATGSIQRRVQHLREQVEVPEPANRRREALRSVKRAVDRFSERDMAYPEEAQDDLVAAISEIRSRQGAMPSRRASDMPELRELGALVGGMSQRLETLEGELKGQRNGVGQIREVAGQVEQLTQVVEMLAGAVGETGQVKRLESQMAALAVMIEDAPKVDLGAVNARLDDVSATVAKLADLQAQQMEREIARDKRSQSEAKNGGVERLAPAMEAIESSVRNVYDRIDAIERNVTLSAGDFERVTTEMADITKAMKSLATNPDGLIERLNALAGQLESIDSVDNNVAGLRNDVADLREAVVKSMEPRFLRIESQIEALSDKVAPADTGAVQDQLRALMQRMDDAGAQLDELSRLYSGGEDRPDLESLASMVAERTSEAMAKKAPAPVAMFGPDSLKSIEDRIGGLIKSAGKTPDYDKLADLVASRASEAFAKAPAGASAMDGEGMSALEQRMTALFNTAGKETAERLARLEATLAERDRPAMAEAKPASPEAEMAQPPARNQAVPSADSAAEVAKALDNTYRAESDTRLDSILASLGAKRSDSMPANPADDAPLVDKGVAKDMPASSPLSARTASARPAKPEMPARAEAPASAAPAFDPTKVDRPPRPVSSFAADGADPFAQPPAPRPSSEPQPAQSSTNTFVAAARRAQRAKQEPVAKEESNSLFGRAVARVRSRRRDGTEQAAPTEAPVAPVAAALVAPIPAIAEPSSVAPEARQEKPAKRAKAEKPTRRQAAPKAPAEESFLTRHRRPLLLAATLVAVSMLALNLVLQRSAQQVAAPTASASAPATQTSNPPPSDDQSSVVPPRVIDLVDTVATGTINPGEPMSFTKSALATPMPSKLQPVTAAAAEGADTPDTADAINTGAIEVQSLPLPPEALGPEAFRQAAADGDARAQFELAAIYTEGQVVPQDYAEAAVWYERAAAQGFAPAQYRLGNLFEMGTGVEQDLDQARLWYQRAAEAGNRMAMHNLAALYAGGQMGDQQFEMAAEWFERAAARGMTDSQFNLGMLYARGLGVDQDFEQSYKWFSLAARSGDADAGRARDDIAKSLTADAVGRLNGQVEAWTAEPIDLAANFAPIGTWTEDFVPGETIATKDVVLKVQQALTRLGFDVGTPDGVAGPKTAQAVRAFERGVGMSEIGQINPRFLAVLGSQPV